MGLSRFIDRLKTNSSINLLRHLSQLLIGILIARQLGVEAKGLHFVFTSIAAAIAILGSFGLVNSIVYHAKKKYISTNQVLIYFAFTLLVLLLVSSILYLIAFQFLVEMLFDNVDIYYEVLWLLFFYISTSLLNYFINTYCLAFGWTQLYFFSFAFGSISCLFLITAGLFYANFGIFECLAIVVLTELACGFISIVVIYRFNAPYVLEKRKKRVDVFRYALQSYLGVSGNSVISHGDSLILSIIFTQETLGLYSIAKTLFRLFVIVPQTINSTIFGVLCDLSFFQASKLVKQVCVGLFGFFSVGFFLSVFILEPAIVFIWGSDFSPAYTATIILVLAATLLASTAAINPLLLVTNRPIWSSKITLVSGLIGLSLCTVLAPYWEAEGAAFSVLISASITALMRIYYFNRLHLLNKK